MVDSFFDPALMGILAGHNAPPIDISSWKIIDSDRDIDIVTIAIPENFDPKTINKSFCRPQSWPPKRVARGEVALFVGMPGIHRKIISGGIRNHFTPVCDSVSSVSNRHFVLADENGRNQFEYQTGLPAFGPTGGVSGAPVFINREKQLILSGVVYEGGETEQATFFAAHADFINSDWTINRDLPR